MSSIKSTSLQMGVFLSSLAGAKSAGGDGGGERERRQSEHKSEEGEWRGRTEIRPLREAERVRAARSDES